MKTPLFALLLMASAANAETIIHLSAPPGPVGFSTSTVFVLGFDETGMIQGECTYFHNGGGGRGNPGASQVTYLCGWDLNGRPLYSMPCPGKCPSAILHPPYVQFTELNTWGAPVWLEVSIQGTDSQGNIAGEVVWPREGVLVLHE